MDTNKDKTGTTNAEKDKTTNSKSGTTSTDSIGRSTTAGEDSGNEKTVSGSTSSSQMNSDMENTNPSSKKPTETEKDGPLFKFFTDGLKDIYYAEKHLLEALPKMKEAATTSELQEAFEDHHLITQKHISRLEKVFKIIGEKAEAKKCDAIIGIVKEGETCIKETEEGTMTRDAGLIISAQKAEHYEIASYGGLAALAETLEMYDVSDLLHKTLEEEEQTDRDLTEIAESFINFGAKEDDQDGESLYDDEDYDEEYSDNEENYRNRNDW